jgi:hypothetical protein
MIVVIIPTASKESYSCVSVHLGREREGERERGGTAVKVTRRPTYMHKYIIHIYTNIHPHIHTYINTYIHTYIYIYIHIYTQNTTVQWQYSNTVIMIMMIIHGGPTILPECLQYLVLIIMMRQAGNGGCPMKQPWSISTRAVADLSRPAAFLSPSRLVLYSRLYNSTGTRTSRVRLTFDIASSTSHRRRVRLLLLLLLL